MFDNVPGQEPDDMFAKVDAPQPVSPTAPSAAPASMPPLPPMNEAVGGGFPWKGVLVTVVSLVVIGAGGTLSYFFLSSRTPPVPAEAPAATTAPAAPTAPEPTINSLTEPAKPPSTASAIPSAPAIQTPPVTIPEADTDHDGLPDVREIQLGTDPNNADTDGDGLTDGEEVNIYHTDPLKADTDGDGFSDGTEVKNGYNPNGPGKLFQVPTTTTPTK